MKTNTQYPKNGSLSFQQAKDQTLFAEDLNRLKAADSLINIVLGEMQYIGKLRGHQTIAPVENYHQKIAAAYKRIDQYLNRNEQNLEQGIEPTQEASNGPAVEKHPLLPELGGMNLEWDNMDLDWMKELDVDQMQDRAEMQNQLKDKLQNKIKNALKLASELQNKIKNKPAFRPAQKQTNELVTKYKLTLEKLKNTPILKPEAPEYQPTYVPPPPRPFPGSYGG